MAPSATAMRQAVEHADGLGGDADIAVVGALLSDRARCRILQALGDGRALPASRLASEAGVAASTASSHLGKLVDGHLLAVEQYGRHRYYRMADERVARLVELLSQLAPPAPVTSLRQGTRARALREARTCYDHLAGQLGVALMRSLIDAGHVVGGDGTFDPDAARRDRRAGVGRDLDYELTAGGRDFLVDLGAAIPPRPHTRYCVDWSEQRHHLAGGVGRELLTCLTGRDWVRRHPGSRAVQVTDAGRDGLRAVFGVEL